jgi:hypothetical protein
LRRQLKLGNLVHWEVSSTSLGGEAFTLGFEELPFSFHPPRVSDSHNSRDTNTDGHEDYTGRENWVDRTGYCGLVPVADRDLHLASLNLRIKMVEDNERGSYYVAYAKYVLDNVGPNRDVLLEVPMECQYGSVPPEADMEAYRVCEH